MMRTYLIVFLIILFSPLLYAQDSADNILILNDDQQWLSSRLLTVDRSDLMNPDQKQEIFNDFQTLIPLLLNTRHAHIGLLEELLKKQLQLYSDERKPFIDYAKFHMNMSNVTDAFVLAQDSLKRENQLYNDPNEALFHTAHSIIGQYYLENQIYSEAYTTLGKSIDMNCRFALTYMLMGNTCFRLEKYDECVSSYDQGFKLDFHQAAPMDYFFYAVSLSKQGHLDRAEVALQLGIQKYPNEEGLHLNMGYVLRKQRKLFEAMLQFHTEMILFGPDGTFHDVSLSNIQTTEAQINKDGTKDEQAMMFNLTWWDKYLGAAAYDDALEKLRIVRTLYESHSWFLSFCLAQTYKKMHKYRDALAVLDTMEAFNSGVSVVLIEKAEIYVLTLEYIKAYELIKQVQQTDSDNWKLQNFLEKVKKAE